MRLEDFSPGTPWAITPEYFDTLTRHVSELVKSPDFAERAVSWAPSSPSGEDLYSVTNGVARIPITGPISKRQGLFQWFFGGTDLETLTAAVNAAVADQRVKSILLAIDSPGGTVSGLTGAAEVIYQARQSKPIVAHSSGLMASAAYWLGSAANKVVISPEANIGSIGVLVLHVDASRMYEKFGLKATYITAGKYKALGNETEPLSEEARAYIQELINQTYQLFISSVARHRGVSESAVAADGRVYSGQTGVDVGLADAIGQEHEAVALLASINTPSAVSAGKRKGNMEIKTVEELRASFPVLVEQVEQDARKSAETGTAQAAEAAAKAAKDNILALASTHFGDEQGAAFAAIVESGATAEVYKAIKAAAPQQKPADPDAKTKAEMLAAINKAGAEAVGADQQQTGAEPGFEALVAGYQAANSNCKKSVAIQAIAKAHPAAHKAWLAEQQKKK